MGTGVVRWVRTPEYRREYRLKNLERTRQQERDSKKRHRDKVLARKKAYRKRQADKIREYNRAYAEKNRERDRAWKADWEARNPGLVAKARVRRKAAEARAIPEWVDRTALNEIYARCERVRECTGLDFHVDHVIPLRGMHVCGLHVPWNLQILPALANLRKSNKLVA